MDDADLEAVTTDEAAELLRITKSNLYSLHHSGKLTIRKIGSRSLILKSELRAVLHDDANILPRDQRKADAARAVRFKNRQPEKAATAAAPASEPA